MSTALAIDPVRTFRPAEPLGPGGAGRTAPSTGTHGPAPLPTPRPEAVPSPGPASAATTAARPRVLAAGVLVAGAAAVVVAQLLLSIGTADGAFRLAALEHRSAVLTRQQQAQTEALRALAAPQALAARAAALGMVPDDAPAYLDARTGAVQGSRAKAAGVPEAPGDLVR